MKLTPRPTSNSTTSDESLIPLINIVFLILIFFLVAASIRPFTAPGIKPAASSSEDASGAINFALMIDRTGALQFNNQPITEKALLALAANKTEKPELIVIADKDLEAATLIKQLQALSSGAFKSIKLLTKKETAE